MTHHEPIARTGFLVSLASYLFFWLLDVAHPGFVARYFSVHIFLLGVILFGIWWAVVVEEYVDHHQIQFAFAVVFGILVSVLVWNIGSSFGVARGIVSLLALLVPVLVLRLVRYK